MRTQNLAALLVASLTPNACLYREKLVASQSSEGAVFNEGDLQGDESGDDEDESDESDDEEESGSDDDDDEEEGDSEESGEDDDDDDDDSMSDGSDS